MSEKQNDSPAFRLRPRAEPKSYYTIRLEYSANPAAFTRERPRSSLTKRRTTSTRSSYSRTKSGTKSTARYDYSIGLPYERSSSKLVDVMTKEDIEREERHRQLQREISNSITTDKMISPFLQRLELLELRPSSIYELNYITLKVDKVSVTKQPAAMQRNDDGLDNNLGRHIVCRCSGIDEADTSNKRMRLNVHLFDDFANENLIKVNKIMNIAKFKTGPAISSLPNPEIKSERDCLDLNFDVIVKYDSLSSMSSDSSSTTITSETNRKKPLIPYVCITDMIEEPTDPYVELAPPSPTPSTASHIAPSAGNIVEEEIHIAGI